MQNIFLMRGRLRRLHFLFFTVALNLVVSMAIKIAEIFDSKVLLAIFGGCIVWLALTLGIKRAHDIGSSIYVRVWSGVIFVLVALLGLRVLNGGDLITDEGFGTAVAIGFGVAIACVIIIMNIIFIFMPGQVGPNRYGNDPRDRKDHRGV